jgi:hypothetical protein
MKFIKKTVHLSKYSKHTLYTEQASFTKSSTSSCNPYFFTLLRISYVWEETLLRFCVAAAEKLTVKQSTFPILNFFPFQFPEYLNGTLILWNISATHILLLNNFQRTSKVLLDEIGIEKIISWQETSAVIISQQKRVTATLFCCVKLTGYNL